MDKLIIALLGLIISTFIGGIESTCFAQIEGEKQVQMNEILIAPNCISVPLEIILLVRKDGSCGAIKFIKVYTGKADQDLYADYVSYYQGDGTG